MKSRIAIIIPGGIGVGHFSQGIPILETLIERLAIHFDVTVFPLGKVNPDYQPKGFQLQPLQEDYDHPVVIRILKTIRLVWLSHRQKKFDILHGIWTFPAGWIAVLLSKWLDIKSVVSMQGGGLARIPTIRYGGRLHPIRRRLIQWSLTNIDVLTAESKFQRDLISDPDISSRVKVIPYGVDNALFSFDQKSLNGPVQFIHIANLNLVKDQVTLLKAFRLIRDQIDCFLTIIGPDYLDGQLQALVREWELEDAVSFEGFIRHREIPRYLSKAHILLHTSLHEGMPLVAVEAMASGVVVCGTDVGIMADLSSECCVTVPVKQYEELAKEVLKLVNDPERYQDLQIKGWNWAKTHTIDWTVDQFMGIYRAISQTINVSNKSA